MGNSPTLAATSPVIKQILQATKDLPHHSLNLELPSMDTNPLNKGVLTENSNGIGTVTRRMVRQRAVELAVINGRLAHEMSKADLDQARRELTGGSDLDPQTAALEAVPESQRWEPVLGSTGQKAPESPNEDEDAEGRSESEQLVEHGVAEAEHDQMLQAARAARKNSSEP